MAKDWHLQLRWSVTHRACLCHFDEGEICSLALHKIWIAVISLLKGI